MECGLAQRIPREEVDPRNDDHLGFLPPIGTPRCPIQSNSKTPVALSGWYEIACEVRGKKVDVVQIEIAGTALAPYQRYRLILSVGKIHEVLVEAAGRDSGEKVY